MLFWLFIIILAVGISLFVVGNKEWDRKNHPFLYENDYKIGAVGIWTTGISALVLAVMVFILCGWYINLDAQVERNKEIYEGITYKVTSGACRDEFGLLSKEVVDEVQKWNEDVRYYKAAQRDFWIGIFIPNVFDQFETIDYEKYSRE
jgi:hypothetical protein